MELVSAQLRACPAGILPPITSHVTRCRRDETTHGGTSSMQKGLNFELPRPAKTPGNGSPFQSRQAFEAWLQQFTVATPEQTAQTVTRILEEMNTCQMAVEDRLYALSRLFGYVTLTADLFAEHSSPDSEDLFKELASQQSVLDRFGQGCCLVIQELLENESRKNAATANLTRAIHLAISSYSQLMVEGYANHYVGADASWKYLNQLYLLAEHLGLAELDTVDHSSIRSSYLRIAVLALSNPYHLMPGEARRLYKWLDEWVKYVELGDNKTASISGKPFVDLAKPNPPVHLRKNMGWQQLKPTEGRLIGMDKLIKGLDKLLQGMLIQQHGGKKSSLNQRIQRDFFLRLRDSWGERKERQMRRDECRQEIEVATGLSAVSYYMREAHDENVSAFLEQEAEQGDVMSGSHLSLVSYEDSMSHSRPGVWSRIELQQNTPASKVPDHIAVENKFPLNTWLQCDISEGGLAVCHARNQANYTGSGEVTEDGASFSLPRTATPNVKVGDLIAYRTRETEGERWEVGTIRWMRLDRRTGIKFGIMRITREAEAARVRAINGVGAGSAHGDALLINKNGLFGGSIITPAAIYDIGTRLEFAEERFGSKLITLSRQLMSSSKFSLFEFQAV